MAPFYAFTQAIHTKERFEMNISTAAELRALFLKFMQEKGHALIPSASVIP